MARILDLFLDRKTNRACSGYPDNKSLFEALGREESGAIRCLYARTSGGVFNIGQANGLTSDDIEELICDCITVCIEKIRAGQYVFQGYSPASFVLEIAKNKAKNYRRSQARRQWSDLEKAENEADEPDFGSFSETEWLHKMLDQLDDNCQNLIRLKYLDEWRDKEVIDQKLTQYTTVDALKNHRSKCLKKLVEIAAALSNDQK